MNPTSDGWDDDDGTDWFAEAMDYAVSSPRAQNAREAAASRADRERALKEIRDTFAKNKAESAVKVADRLAARIAATSKPTHPADHAAALKAFGIAATAAGTAMGGISGSGGLGGGGIISSPSPFDAIYKNASIGRPPREMTPEQGFEAILKAVRNSADPFKSAGEWITKITLGLAAIANQPEE